MNHKGSSFDFHHSWGPTHLTDSTCHLISFALNRGKQMAATAMNMSSSRSHTVLMLSLLRRRGALGFGRLWGVKGWISASRDGQKGAKTTLFIAVGL